MQEYKSLVFLPLLDPWMHVIDIIFEPTFVVRTVVFTEVGHP